MEDLKRWIKPQYLMQHTGELMERLAAHTDAEIDWVGWKHD